MLFNVIQIREDNFKTNTEVREVNATEMCLSNLQETAEEWYNLTKKTMYLENKSLKENNATLLNLSIRNFFEKVIEILTRMRDNLITYWNKFKNYVVKYDLRNTKLLKKYQGILLKKDMKGFSAPCFNYTISKKIPNLNVKDSFLSDFTRENIEKITEMDLIKLETSYTNFADNFRGSILNKKEGIKKEEFVKELYLSFRNGKNEKGKIKLASPQAKTEFCNAIVTFNKDIWELEKTKNEITLFYENVISYFNNFSNMIEQEGNIIIKNRSNDSSLSITSDRHDLLATYGELKSRMCQSALAIYNLAFSMKLDAFKERNNEYRLILIQALNYKIDENDFENRYTDSIFDEI